ncbi:MAG TPA: hypothetical protein VFH34_06185 [Anaerolineales bacterium]|nr:hypothetical protein [Anaerolineales bacterium]
MTGRTPAITCLIILCIFFGSVAGCIPQSTPPAAQPTPTIAPGCDRFVNEGQCGYVIDFPADMDGAQQGTYSWIVSPTTAEPSGPAPNFIYISVIPDDFQSDGNEIIYNYDPVETRTLLSLQVGESRSLRDDPNLASWFTYTRLQDTALGNQTAQAYENDQPWEFPLGTKEIRYYLQVNSCTYLIGGYMATVGSGQPGAIDQELLEQILATFRMEP